MMRYFNAWHLLLAVLLATARALSAAAPSEELAYNRDIRPILSDNCFYCHGPDANKRKGKLRLDVREEAIKKEAFIPGKADESTLIKRIHSTDPDELMPPPDSNKKLSADQKEILHAWIDQGAKYEGHWAYVPPRKVQTPPGSKAIDVLISTRLKKLGLEPSPRADRRTLIRRLYFDLAGLPPAPEMVRAFEEDKNPGAYGELVEKLLASPEYGERMAIGWLDVVRFADTIGYHSDNPRNIWPYRDYVIKSFNENKPFDQFTREQIAGDLLPGSSQEQKVGSAFNRLLLSTEEGGAQPKDYEARMLTDRVRSIGTVWLGQTIGCAQCHDHKFDPITSRDFYSLGAFFADIKEPIIGRREDGMLTPNPEQAAELARLNSEVQRWQENYDKPHPELEQKFSEWETEQRTRLNQDKEWQILRPARLHSAGGAKLRKESDGSILAQDKNPDKDTYTITITNVPTGIAAFRLEALPHDSLPAKGPGRAGNGNFVLTEVAARLERSGQTQEVAFASARATIEQTLYAEESPYKKWAAAAVIDRDAKGEKWGWAILPEAGKPQQIILRTTNALAVEEGEKLVIQLRQGHGNNGHNLGHFRISITTNSSTAEGPFVFPPSGELAALLAVGIEKRTEEQRQKVFAQFKAAAAELEPLRRGLEEARKKKNDFEAGIPRCLVSVSMETPRVVRILPRGNFLIDTGEIMSPALPAYLCKAESKGQKLTRLDLANWLMAPTNPLPARVTMNRVWKQFFGNGLAKVLDDFGAQGEPPPNQALLDWLAAEFIESGWDVKHMVRLLVESDAYQRSSTPSALAKAKDPYNREYSCQSRWRLDAELVRDNALAIGGLLVRKLGGPSVKPYQPDGYWENLNFPTRTWDASKGPDQYRRGLYTWWQRSFLHPSLVAFDAPSREECVAERNRSNIPQQALALLNDPTYVEAARAFAVQILEKGARDTAARLAWAWGQALQRRPRADEMAALSELLEKDLAFYRSNPEEAKALLKVGQAPTPSELDPAETAAWTNAARVILNLHETITRS